MEPIYERVEDFARRVQRPVSTIRNMCKTNVLPSFKMGREWRIDVSKAMLEFEKQIESRKSVVKVKPIPVVKPKPKMDYISSLRALL